MFIEDLAGRLGHEKSWRDLCDWPTDQYLTGLLIRLQKWSHRKLQIWSTKMAAKEGYYLLQLPKWHNIIYSNPKLNPNLKTNLKTNLIHKKY